MLRDLVIGMAGSGGDGVVSAGETLVTAGALEGYHVMMTKSFGSQIRGGESSCRVRISTAPALNPGGVLDVAVALNWEDFLRFGAELPVGGATVVIYESATGVAPDALPLPGMKPTEVAAVPIGDIARRAAGSDRAKNAVVLGLLSGWFAIPADGIMRGLTKRLGKKGAELIEATRRAFDEGVKYAAEHPLSKSHALEVPSVKKPKMIADGNEMCAMGALFSGCEFFGGYPITPSTEVMQTLSKEIWKYGGALLQAEDEIAGIGCALGASFAGKKSMTATSGPGMSLKSEIMGLASLAELPLVIVNVQRGGPSTGLPTKPEQADLYQAAFSAHGDVLRPVLAPTSAADSFAITVEAFNLAEHYQTPVIVLSDQGIAQRKEAFDPIDTSRFTIVSRAVASAEELATYHRYKYTPSGISPLTHPGMAGGAYLGAGIEHDETGAPTASGSVHAKMNDKRFDKLNPLKEREDLFLVEGDVDAPLAMIAWGSSAGVCREALEMARTEGLKAKVLVPYLVYPIAEGVYARFLASVRAGLVVELSHQAQLYRMLRMFVDVPPGVEPFCRSGAQPFQPSEIVARLRELAMAMQRKAADKSLPTE